MNQTQLNKEWIQKLRSGRDDVILTILKELRFSGNNEVLPAVVSLLESSKNHEVLTEVMSFLNDLKSQSSVDVLVENVAMHRGKDYFARLVGSCWQNGLNYSEHTDFFIDVILQEDYAAAIEAFTVIEGSISHLTSEAREQKASELEALKPGISRQKEPLVEELISVLRPFSGPFQVDPDP